MSSSDGITLSRNQLSSWAGFTLTDEEVARIGNALPSSTLPEIVGVIAAEFRPDTASDELEAL